MTYQISGRTKVCGLIADPIEHAMSPVMHNAAFKKLGLDYVYVPFKVKPEDLKEAISGLRALNVRGFNITIPHKMAALPFLDKIDPIAGKIGAVNTVVNDDGILTGYNTDASGFLQSLLEEGIEPGGKHIVILGAGGSAKAIAFILAERGAHLVILNRHVERAEELARRISPDVKAGALTGENLADVLKNADIVVNTTSVGMVPDINATPVPAHLISSKLLVVDIVYNPIETRLLKEAKAAGARTIDGMAMLVWQGAQGFEKWTGVKAPVTVMREEVLKGLRHEK
jgi:shikimate dehydrogenase